MVTLEDIESKYIMESYIAESGEVEAEIQDVLFHKTGDKITKFCLILRIGELEYAISQSTNGEDLVSFLDELGFTNLTDLTELEGEYVTVGINKSLDQIRLSKDSTEYSVQEPPSGENWEENGDSHTLSEHIELYRAYYRDKNSDYGLRREISSIEAVSESTIRVEVSVTENNTLEWELSLPETKDTESSDTAWFVEEIGQGSPTMMEGEYVTIVLGSDDKPYLRSVSGKNNRWNLTTPTQYSKRNRLQSKYEAEQKRNRTTTNSNNSSHNPGVVLGLIIVLVCGISLVGFIGFEIVETIIVSNTTLHELYSEGAFTDTSKAVAT